jgi:hypothetical protein
MDGDPRDDPLKIKLRCGHASFSTTEMYIREAEAVREGFGEVFLALPAALVGIVPGRFAAPDPAEITAIRERDTGFEPVTFGLGSPESIAQDGAMPGVCSSPWPMTAASIYGQTAVTCGDEAPAGDSPMGPGTMGEP